MTRRLLQWLFLLTLFPASASALACSCLWDGPFKNAIAPADVVVMGTVNARAGNSMDIAVESILKGGEFRDTVRVWGQYKDLCRPALADFTPGSRWIVALQRIDQLPQDAFDPFKPNISFGRKADYTLSSCTVSWLPVNDGMVSGNIVDGTRWQYLDPKKSPVLLGLFTKWFNGDIGDSTLAEAARPQREARELLNNTRFFLWELERESGDGD